VLVLAMVLVLVLAMVLVLVLAMVLVLVMVMVMATEHWKHLRWLPQFGPEKGTLELPRNLVHRLLFLRIRNLDLLPMRRTLQEYKLSRAEKGP
jgi:hypothetical protein